MKRHFLHLLAVVFALNMMAAPAVKGTYTYTQPDGSTIVLSLNGDEFYHYTTDQNGQTVELGEDGYYHPIETIDHATFLQRRAMSPRLQQAKALRKAAMNFNPAPRGIVILVSYSDLACQSATTQAAITEMCNGDNYTYDGAYGSARKYFLDQSNGLYAPQFDVYGPVTLPHNYAYYGANDAEGNDMRPQQMIIDACRLADSMFGVDFSLYDSDNDEVIDFVYVIYAGYAENVYGVTSDAIWPHAWAVHGDENGQPVILDGKYVSTYACSSELGGNSGTSRCGIGTLCHEFSHVLGQPDYYDTYYGYNFQHKLTPGDWDVMDGGCHNDDLRRPSNYSVYEKACFGWATPQLLNMRQSLNIPADGQTYYYITKDGREASVESPDTVYYIENRQQTGWDRYIPGHGMMIWQVVYDQEKWGWNCPNNTDGQPNYTYVPSDGIYGNGIDAFPGGQNVREWSVPATVYSFANIYESGGVITCDFAVGCTGCLVSSTYESKHLSMPAEQANGCFETGSTYEITYQEKKNYQLDSVRIEMKGQRLVEGVGYTHSGNTIRIPRLTGDVDITYYSQMIPFHHDNCMYYFWSADAPIEGNNAILADINWNVTATGSTYRGLDNELTGRGAQFGSRSTAPGEVVLATDEMSQCLVTEMEVVAATAEGGTGKLGIYIDDELVYRQPLANQLTAHIANNNDLWHGRVELRFTELTKALYLKKIAVHFADERENPAGVDNLTAFGEITAIYSITGTYMGIDTSVLPRGLYLIVRTNGTEKYISK